MTRENGFAALIIGIGIEPDPNTDSNPEVIQTLRSFSEQPQMKAVPIHSQYYAEISCFFARFLDPAEQQSRARQEADI
jgi:hypothetical protein